MSRSSPFRKETCWNVYQFFFWTVSSNFSDFNKKIMTGLPKLPSTVSNIFKGEKHSPQKKLFPSVSDFELMIFGLLVKKIGRLTKLHSMCPEATFEGKNFQIKIISLHLFVNLSWCFSGFWQKCRKYHQSGVLLVETNILPKNYFGEIEFNTCGFSGETLKTSAGKCLEESSEITNFAEKIIRIIYWLWERKFQTFPQKFPAELSERHFTYPKNEF